MSEDIEMIDLSKDSIPFPLPLRRIPNLDKPLPPLKHGTNSPFTIIPYVSIEDFFYKDIKEMNIIYSQMNNWYALFHSDRLYCLELLYTIFPPK